MKLFLKLLFLSFLAIGSQTVSPMGATPLELSKNEDTLDRLAGMISRGELPEYALYKLQDELSQLFAALSLHAKMGNLKGFDCIHVILRELSKKDLIDDIGQLIAVYTNAFRAAVTNGHVGIIRFLIDKRCVNINYLFPGRFSALHLAVLAGHAHVAQYLIKMGIEPDIFDADGQTALHLAVMVDSPEMQRTHMIRCLVENDVYVDLFNFDGSTPLHMAIYMGNVDAIKCLMDCGADASILDPDGRAALHIAARSGGHDIVEALCGYGIDLNILDEKWLAPIHHAAVMGHLKALQCLARNGANLDVEAPNGWPVLHIAVVNRREDLVKYLTLECNVDIFRVSHDRLTAFTLALARGDIDMALLIVKAYARQTDC